MAEDARQFLELLQAAAKDAAPGLRDPEQFLELLQAAAKDAAPGLQDAACRLPQESFTQNIGFRWADMLRAIDCDDQDREAWCVRATMATLVTQQVLTKSDACEFVLQVENVGGEDDAQIFFGVVDTVPTGFGHLPIGHSDLRSSIGISAGPTVGAVVHGGEILAPSPGIRNGDIVKIKISEGSRCALYVGSRLVHGFSVGGDGKFRCAVSMSSIGQRVKILAKSSSPSGSGSAGLNLDLLQQVLSDGGSSSDLEKLALAAALAQLVEKAVEGKGESEASPLLPGQVVHDDADNDVGLPSGGQNAMKVGCEVTMPPRSDPRLSGMRTRYSDGMGCHCGRVGKVVRTGKRSIRTSVDGTEYWWDIELFPRGVRRCCHEGCELSEVAVTSCSRICDVCMVRLPKGSKTWQCRQHDYDVCAYCSGLREVPSVGSKVIRGPTWKWKEQDGTPYTEGVCKSASVSEGWVSVQWPGGSTNKYRVNTHYQDVWAAHDNGLAGQQPVPVDDEKKKDDGASKLPKMTYSRSEGFTWVDTLKSVNCDPRDKMATCVTSMAATMVTAQVLTRDDECDFILRVVNVGGEGDEPVCFGVVDDVPNGFSRLPIGHPDLKPSIGACCTKKAGAIVVGGERKRLFPALSDGDIVKIHVGRGSEVSLFKGAQSYMSFKVQGNGRFRLGATFTSKGQRMEILDAMPDDSAGGQNAMKVGCEVTMPPKSDPRLSGMRTRYSDGMGGHCGRVGKVVRTSKRCIRTSIDGTEYWWDIELFPRGVRRCCHEGCELPEVAVTSCGYICDVCMVRLPKGSKTWLCRQHNYVVCAYCNGLCEVPSVGSKVIRGPTWKWKEQDGTPYTEGVCKSAPDSDGWVNVQWAGGSTNKYRVSTHYQDVWAAHDNGLAGQKPVPVDDEEKKGSADLGKLLSELLKHHMEKDIPHRWVLIPSLEILKDSIVAHTKLTWDDRLARLAGVKGQVRQDDPKDGTSQIFFPPPIGLCAWLPTGMLINCKDGSSNGPLTLPSHSYTPDTGFTFVPDCVPEVEVGGSKKDARAVKENPTHWGSIVTEQVVAASSDTPVVFSIQIKAFPALSEQGVFAWGICTSQATNFQKHIPGTKEFKGSISCLVTRHGGVVLHDGNVCKALPDVASGDMVGARFHRGRCELLHQGRVVYSVGVQGKFRFVVCLGSVEQHVVIQGASAQSTTKTDFAKSVPHVDIGKGANQLNFTEDEASELGRGGFGVVYRGKLFGDVVVVKKMLADATTDEMQQNFEQEVQALAALRHKNLVIFLGINAAEHLIVTEFCELGDLKNYIENQGKNTSADHRRGLMLDVTKGMACIAGQGMVHRDLKPENVLLSAPGPVAKIGDFGLVMPLAQCRSEGGIAGSLLYMAPEVFLGQISEKSDVYAFSLVLGFAFGMEELDVSSLTNMGIAMMLAHIEEDPRLVHHVIIDAIRNGKRPQLTDSVPAEIKTLVKEGWDEMPEKRPTFVSLSESLTQPLLDSSQA